MNVLYVRFFGDSWKHTVGLLATAESVVAAGCLAASRPPQLSPQVVGYLLVNHAARYNGLFFEDGARFNWLLFFHLETGNTLTF